MALILHRREIVTSQPKESFEIDWSNPITRGLVFAFTPNSDRNLVDGLAPFYTSGTAKKDAGIELGLTSTAYSAVWKVPAFTNNCSLLLRASAIQTGGHLSAVSSTAVESGHFLSYEASNWNMFSEGGNGYPCAKRADPFGTAQGLRTVIGVNTDRSLRDIYVNGLKGSTSTLTQPNTLMNQVGFGFIDRTTYFTTPLTKCYNQAAIWNRALSEAEIKSLSDNPWQIFAPRESRLFVPAGGGGTSLTVQDATHAHIADSPSFSMATYLAVAESLHAHAADNVTLATTGTANLVVQEATHAHVADGVSLTTQWLLAVAEALHTHTAESVTLSLQTALVVLEALHTHAAENLTLGVTGTANLTIADATSGHTSDTVALTLNSLLAVFDASHTHAADSLTLDTSNATALTVQESTHSHGADSLGLSLDTWLAIVEAAHGHTADAPTLSTALALQVAESLHAHYADVVVLGFPSAPGSCPTVEEIVAAVLAAINATTGPRTLGQHLQIQTAVLAGATLGAGTGHIEFIDGATTVEADVPMPGQSGDRANVVITGV